MSFVATHCKTRTISALSLVLVLLFGTNLPGGAQKLPAEVHPSLLFSAGDIPTLKDRITRQPYSIWWKTVLDRANSIPTSIADERTKARYAKSAAFAFLMTDDTVYAEKAKELLLDMKFPPRGGDLGEPHNEGEVVAIYAVAYDMLHNYLQGSPLTEIRKILAEEAQRLHKGLVIFEVNLGLKKIKLRLHETPDPRDPGTLHLDNWHVRAYGGLGLAAMALSDYTGEDNSPQQWSDRAFDLVTRSLWHQIDDVDGGYAEGPFYMRYAADVYLPYMFALKNLTGVDLFFDPQIQKMHHWSLNQRMPNGRRPNTEDGHVDDWYGHYLSAVYPNGGVHRWDWENNVNGLYTREFSEMDAIAIFDDAVRAVEPDHGPTIFMPEAGDAVFRSDWSEDAVYMLLRGEHGTARAQGLGHEHPDEISFILYGGREMLALDAGYINFINHNKVNRGGNHNVIMVDGQGPPNIIVGEGVPGFEKGASIDGGKDAFIEETFTSEFVDYAEVRARYSGVDIRRNVMFVDKTYFVMGDELRDDASHTYEWRLHGHGGGNGGGQYERKGTLAKWIRPKAELIAFMPPQDGLVISEKDMIHSFDYLQEPTHTMLQVEQSGKNVNFLTILYPREVAGTVPRFTGLTVSGGKVVQMDHENVTDLSWLHSPAATNIQFMGPDGVVESDARFGLVRYNAEKISGFNVQDGKYLTAGGKEIFNTNHTVDVSLEIASKEVHGFVRGPESGYKLALNISGAVGNVNFSGSLTDVTVEKQTLVLTMAGQGYLNISRDHSAPTAVLADWNLVPTKFDLLHNFPNPFNAHTQIAYSVAQTGHTELVIFNLTGQIVRTLVDEVNVAGNYQITWDGKDNAGVYVGSGVYVCKLNSGTTADSHRLLLLQ